MNKVENISLSSQKEKALPVSELFSLRSEIIVYRLQDESARLELKKKLENL